MTKLLLKDFQQLSTRTAPHNADPQNHIEKQYLLTNYVIGLDAELREFETESINYSKKRKDLVLSEAGDVLHYAVILLKALGKNATDESLGLKFVGYLDVNVSACQALEIIKKTYYHGHEFKETEFVESVKTVINYIYSAIGKDNFYAALQINIDKLKKRYPDGFSSEDSIARVDVQ